MKVKFNCTYTMGLDKKSGKVKCGILRKIKQKQKKACVTDAFFFKNGSQNICDDVDFTVLFPVSP